MANVSLFHRSWLVSMSLFWLVEATCAVAAATFQTADSLTPGQIVTTTLAATAVTQTSATLNGRVTPGSPFLQTTVLFKYSSNAVDWVSVFAVQSPLTFGAGTTVVSANVASLRCGTVYSFYVFAYGSGLSPSNGDNLQFVTSPCTPTQQIPANSHVALVLLATMVCLIGAAYLWRVPVRSG